MAQIVKIISITNITHDVVEIIAEKPEGIHFNPGQAVDFAINKSGWEQEWRSFTFTSHPSDNFIAFNIKVYPSHNSVTNQLLTLQPGDEILIGDVYGDIAYKGEGIFIAGGAGITPFLAILKDLKKEKIERKKANKYRKNRKITANMKRSPPEKQRKERRRRRKTLLI